MEKQKAMIAQQTLAPLLQAHCRGDRKATDELFALVYDELRGVAHRQLRFRRPGQTINTTALVHEAYLKLLGNVQGTGKDKAHFLAVMARAMRQILVDYARKVQAEKRGGNAQHVELKESIVEGDGRTLTVLDIDHGLARLAQINPRYGRIVELRFFGGLSAEEIADVLEVSSRTVERDWTKAKRLLYLMLQEEEHAC